ncbi:GNAT family N-acetyltransferase [Fredinandcohnia quinoae]|uniref:N-acetyltransferase domain-containing protein n=1 Tax=Fredinandcohnia quinoae TaxID=2918902 RepID=A0AAW5E0L7_9BACI|nr:hypothetical protein [Fredinandcohnia sp. SECRCQ15]MCH1625124.1 hypothetical protein [Fredinandcohnia sp. SECRCQ15]
MKQIRIANVQDIDNIKRFLGRADVSSEGIDSIIDHFIVMEDVDYNILATIGIERIEKDGLLRSLVITQGLDQTEVLALFKSVLSLAKKKELEHLYLTTNIEASIQFFELLGFTKIDMCELPTHLQTSDHITQLCHSVEPMFMFIKVA